MSDGVGEQLRPQAFFPPLPAFARPQPPRLRPHRPPGSLTLANSSPDVPPPAARARRADPLLRLLQLHADTGDPSAAGQRTPAGGCSLVSTVPMTLGPWAYARKPPGSRTGHQGYEAVLGPVLLSPSLSDGLCAV
ncbi:hypothetical protein CB1_000385011 [Camelus ferus]|nr:hypothetical protein CB1_000385011 [Camelus ferus]